MRISIFVGGKCVIFPLQFSGQWKKDDPDLDLAPNQVKIGNKGSRSNAYLVVSVQEAMPSA